MRQDTSTAPLSHKRSAHRRHTTNCHSRAHGKPFVRTRRMSRLEMHLPQQPLKQANSSNFNTAIAINHSIRSTMGPRVREDDEKKTKRKSRQTEVRKKKVRRVKDERKHQQRHYPVKTQHTASTPPGVIPVHTGIHLSARAGCRVWKHTRHNRQQEQRQYSSNAYPLHSPYHGPPRSRG